jgi:hypothetical protein
MSVQYATEEKMYIVPEDVWDKAIDREINYALLRGDIISVESNPLARRALISALKPVAKA